MALPAGYRLRAELFGRWMEEQEANPSHDPTLWLLARAEGRTVGVLTGHAGGDYGWVDYLGVLTACRGRRVGMAPLRRSFATFADRGLRRVILNVDAENSTGATALHEHAGMRVINRWDLWERLLGNPRGSNSRAGAAARSAAQDAGLLLIEFGLGQHARRQQLAELLQLGDPLVHVGRLRRGGCGLRRRDGLGVGLRRVGRGRVLRRRCRHGRRVGLVLRRPPILLPALNPAVHRAGDRDRGGGLQ
jgi:hypothetical protein